MHASHPSSATFLAALPLALLSACATGSTFRSGVGDAILDRPPYYAGARAAADSARIAHFPVGYQRGAAQEAVFEPRGDAGTPIAALLADMNAFLDSLGLTTRLESPGASEGTPPDVRFGCETDPTGDCAVDETRALGRGDIEMRLAVGRPSESWVTWTQAALDRAGATRVIVITLEIGQYRVRQRGLRGDKEVELGSGHTASLPWLTSLETPVSVLQLTGALMGRDGRAIRIGAEGMLARRTPLLASAVGAQALITDEEVERLRTARRDDLPGQPLVWQAALGTLVKELTGK